MDPMLTSTSNASNQAGGTPAVKRVVLVVDRGWIFAGDVTEENGRIYLDRVAWVFSWEKIGFMEVIRDPKQPGTDIRPSASRVDVPAGSEVFRIPVDANWGL